MKKFKVTEYIYSTTVQVYEVEANSREEAENAIDDLEPVTTTKKSLDYDVRVEEIT